MLSKIQFTIVDAFSDKPFGGNPAGESAVAACHTLLSADHSFSWPAVVILENEGDLTEATKQLIAM